MLGSKQRWLKRAGTGLLCSLAAATTFTATQGVAQAATRPGDAQIDVWRADYRCPASQGYHLVKDKPLREFDTNNTRVYAWLRVYRNKHHICAVNLASRRTMGSRRFRQVDVWGLSVAAIRQPNVDQGMYRHYAGPVRFYFGNHTPYWGVWVGARVVSRTVTRDGQVIHLMAIAHATVHL